MNRRRVLTGLIGGISLLSGCSANIGDDGTETPSTPTASPTANRTENGTETTTEAMSTDSDHTEQPPDGNSMDDESDGNSIGSESDGDSTGDESTEPEADGGSLNLAPLETYTNDSIGYSIDYPVHWTVDDDQPDDIEIENGDEAGIAVGVKPRSEYPGPVDEIADEVIEDVEPAASESSLSKEGETTITSGHPAVVVTGTVPVGSSVSNTIIFVTHTENLAYAAAFVAPEADWSPTVGDEAINILRSLTISDDSGNASV